MKGGVKKLNSTRHTVVLCSFKTTLQVYIPYYHTQHEVYIYIYIYRSVVIRGITTCMYVHVHVYTYV